MIRKVFRIGLFSVTLAAFFTVLAVIYMGWQIPYFDSQFNTIYACILMVLFTTAAILGTNQFGFKWGLISSAVMATALIGELVISNAIQTYGMILAGLMSIIVAICWMFDHTGKIWGRMLQTAGTLEHQAERLGNQLTERKHVEETLALWEWKLNAIIQVIEESRRKGPAIADARTFDSVLSEFVTMLKTINTDMPSDAGAVEKPLPTGAYCILSVSPVSDQSMVEMYNRSIEELAGVTRCMFASFADNKATYHVYGPKADELALALMTISYFRGHNIKVLHNQVSVTLREMAAEVFGKPEPSSRPAIVKDEGVAVETASYQLGVDVFFNARHFIVSGESTGPVHQHSWRVQVNVSGNYLNDDGMLLGFAEAKKAAQDEANRFNGVLLNETVPFNAIPPTTENIATVLYREIKNTLSSLPIRLTSVGVWESPTSHVLFKGNEETTPQDSTPTA